MRAILGVFVALLASTAFAAASVGWTDISEYGGVSTGDTVFPSLLDDPATLIFDNSAPASGLSFSSSTTPYPAGNAWVDFPLQNSNVTIHSLNKIWTWSYDGQGTLSPQTIAIFDGPNAYYTNTQGSADDPRANDYFPYNIPRPQSDCVASYTAVYFDLARPAAQFGVYTPLGSNNWGDAAGAYDDYNYNYVVGRSFYVGVLGVNDTFATATYTRVTITAGYCPFVKVTDSDGGIKGVVVIDDINGAGATIGFMDAYATLTDVLPTPHPGDANNDGAVDVVDLGILAKNYDGAGLAHGSSQSWGLADFNDDGNVDVIDLGILAKNYDWVGTPAGAAAVPEPMTLSLVALGTAVLIRRRR